jgi:hypothetical protein
MVGGKCYSWHSHKFYRHKTVTLRSYTRTIAVKVRLAEPQPTDFCINCGVIRKDVKMPTKNKNKTKTPKSVVERVVNN